jgi:hypothetical protein
MGRWGADIGWHAGVSISDAEGETHRDRRRSSPRRTAGTTATSTWSGSHDGRFLAVVREHQDPQSVYVALGRRGGRTWTPIRRPRSTGSNIKLFRLASGADRSAHTATEDPAAAVSLSVSPTGMAANVWTRSASCTRRARRRKRAGSVLRLHGRRRPWRGRSRLSSSIGYHGGRTGSTGSACVDCPAVSDTCRAAAQIGTLSNRPPGRRRERAEGVSSIAAARWRTAGRDGRDRRARVGTDRRSTSANPGARPVSRAIRST